MAALILKDRWHILQNIQQTFVDNFLQVDIVFLLNSFEKIKVTFSSYPVCAVFDWLKVFFESSEG